MYLFLLLYSSFSLSLFAFLVRSCLLITLIKCRNGHKSLGSFCCCVFEKAPQSLTHSVSESVRHIELSIKLPQFRTIRTCIYFFSSSGFHVILLWADTSPINCGNAGFDKSQVCINCLSPNNLHIKTSCWVDPLILALVVLFKRFMILKYIR